MGSIDGSRFDITGASGTQGLLGPKSSWRAYILPRGGHAAQDSTGTLITFDSADVASRYAANDWIQSGLSVDNIRQVSGVGGDSISVSGAALTVSENDRIFLIGTTQPTVTGGSATYTVPATLVRQRDDDSATLFTNSMITSNAQGLVQFWAATNFYDCIIQDGNQANQASVIDLALGVVGGVSATGAAVFGETVTLNAALGVTGHATFGDTVTIDGILGVTGWAFFGSTVTMHAQLGVSSHATFGDTVTMNGVLGVTGTAIFDAALTANATFGVTGVATFGTTITAIGQSFEVSTRGDISTLRRLYANGGTALLVSGVSLGANWGSGSTVTVNARSNDSRGQFLVTAATSPGANPTVQITYSDEAWVTAPFLMLSRQDVIAPTEADWLATTSGTASFVVTFGGTPVDGSIYVCNYFLIG